MVFIVFEDREKFYFIFSCKDKKLKDELENQVMKNRFQKYFLNF